MIKSIHTPKGTILIREANPTDMVQYRELRLFALQDSPTAFSADYQTNLNHPPEYWQNRLNRDDDSTMFFGEHDQHLIGLTGIARRHSPKTSHTAEIYSVFVRPEWRGLHIAEALIEACLAWAELKDVLIVKLGVLTTSTSAIRCYQRCGFTVYGKEPLALYHEGKYYDGLMMFRLLSN